MRNGDPLLESFDSIPHRPAKDPGDQLIPLINIVFLLLIFFMVAGHIRAASQYQIEPPSLSSRSGPESEPATIQLSKDGIVILQGREISIARLAQEISADSFDLTRAVVVRADRHATAQQLDHVLNIFRASQIGSVKLQVSQSASP